MAGAIPGVELRHLRYFVAVAEASSFTKAAQKLRLAQPSLTRQVRNLEEEIGVRLLDRSRNPLVLTEEGRRFLFEARKILSLCADAVSDVRQMKPGPNAVLNIGYVATIHSGSLPTTLGAFRKLHPHVALNLFDLNSAEQFTALASGKIDLGFVGLRPPPGARDLLCECVAQEAMVVALPVAHELARRAQIHLSDLASQFFIGMSARTQPGAREWLLGICRDAGFEGRILQEADAEATVIKFVADGLGVAFMPRQTSGLPHEGVIFRPLTPPMARESTIAWRAVNPSQQLKDYIKIVKDLSPAW